VKLPVIATRRISSRTEAVIAEKHVEAGNGVTAEYELSGDALKTNAHWLDRERLSMSHSRKLGQLVKLIKHQNQQSS
jgi:hypothetical protein